MPVPAKMADLFTIASSNSPAGSEAIGNSLDDYLRALAAIMRSTNAIASATLASASTTDLGTADAEHVQITGTATISSFGTSVPGLIRECRFAGALTITASSSIITPNSANIVVAAGDVITFRSMGSGVWRAVAFSGVPVIRDASLSIAKTNGLQAALDAIQTALGTKAPLSNPSFAGTVSTNRVSISAAGESAVELLSASGGRNVRLIQSAAGDVGIYDAGTSTYLLRIDTSNNASFLGLVTAPQFSGALVSATTTDINATQSSNFSALTYTSSASNIPSGGSFGSILNIGRTSTSGTQISIRESASDALQHMWFRGYSSGTFASWMEVYHSGNQPRVFVQSGDPGSQPDGTLWIW